MLNTGFTHSNCFIGNHIRLLIPNIVFIILNALLCICALCTIRKVYFFVKIADDAITVGLQRTLSSGKLHKTRFVRMTETYWIF